MPHVALKFESEQQRGAHPVWIYTPALTPGVKSAFGIKVPLIFTHKPPAECEFLIGAGAGRNCATLDTHQRAFQLTRHEAEHSLNAHPCTEEVTYKLLESV